MFKNIAVLSIADLISVCSSLIIPDTKLRGKVYTINEVFSDKTTTYIFS